MVYYRIALETMEINCIIENIDKLFDKIKSL